MTMDTPRKGHETSILYVSIFLPIGLSFVFLVGVMLLLRRYCWYRRRRQRASTYVEKGNAYRPSLSVATTRTYWDSVTNDSYSDDDPASISRSSMDLPARSTRVVKKHVHWIRDFFLGTPIVRFSIWVYQSVAHQLVRRTISEQATPHGSRTMSKSAAAAAATSPILTRSGNAPFATSFSQPTGDARETTIIPRTVQESVLGGGYTIPVLSETTTQREEKLAHDQGLQEQNDGTRILLLPSLYLPKSNALITPTFVPHTTGTEHVKVEEEVRDGDPVPLVQVPEHIFSSTDPGDGTTSSHASKNSVIYDNDALRLRTFLAHASEDDSGDSSSHDSTVRDRTQNVEKMVQGETPPIRKVAEEVGTEDASHHSSQESEVEGDVHSLVRRALTGWGSSGNFSLTHQKEAKANRTRAQESNGSDNQNYSEAELDDEEDER